MDHRPATAGDVEAVLALWVIAAEDADRPAGSHADVQRPIARDHHALLLAVAGGEVVASVIAALGGRRADAMVVEGKEGAHRVRRSARCAAQARWRRWVRVLAAPQ